MLRHTLSTAWMLRQACQHLWRLLMLLGLLWLRPLLLLYVLLLLLRRSIQRLAIQDVEQHLRAQTTVLLLGPAGQQHSKRTAQSVLQQSQHLGLDAKAGYGEDATLYERVRPVSRSQYQCTTATSTLSEPTS